MWNKRKSDLEKKKKLDYKFIACVDCKTVLSYTHIPMFSLGQFIYQKNGKVNN